MECQMTISLPQEKGFKKKAAYMGTWVNIFCEGPVETNRHFVNLEEFSMNKFQGEPTFSPQYSWALLPFSYLISLLSFTGRIISNEKPNFDRIHSAGTNRHPRASICNLHTSLPHLCIQHYWKPDDHHPHTTGLPPPHAHVFLPLELLLLRNFLYNHFYP